MSFHFPIFIHIIPSISFLKYHSTNFLITKKYFLSFKIIIIQFIINANQIYILIIKLFFHHLFIQFFT